MQRVRCLVITWPNIEHILGVFRLVRRILLLLLSDLCQEQELSLSSCSPGILRRCHPPACDCSHMSHAQSCMGQKQKQNQEQEQDQEVEQEQLEQEQQCLHINISCRKGREIHDNRDI